MTFGVRPEDLVIEPAEDGNGRIELVELLGPRYVVIVEIGPRRLTAVVEAAVVAGGAPRPNRGLPSGSRYAPAVSTCSTPRANGSPPHDD